MSNSNMKEKEIWTESVLNSVDGMKRATPRVDLFEDIYSEVQRTDSAKIIQMSHLRWLAAAVAILFLINTHSIYVQLTQENGEMHRGESELTIITNYSLYNN